VGGKRKKDECPEDTQGVGAGFGPVSGTIKGSRKKAEAGESSGKGRALSYVAKPSEKKKEGKAVRLADLGGTE